MTNEATKPVKAAALFCNCDHQGNSISRFSVCKRVIQENQCEKSQECYILRKKKDCLTLLC